MRQKAYLLGRTIGLEQSGTTFSKFVPASLAFPAGGFCAMARSAPRRTQTWGGEQEYGLSHLPHGRSDERYSQVKNELPPRVEMRDVADGLWIWPFSEDVHLR
jgi:hypothetical protein